jgi:hypothetical protein
VNPTSENKSEESKPGLLKQKMAISATVAPTPGAAATEGAESIAIQVTRIQSVWERQTGCPRCAINLVSAPRKGLKAASPPVRGKMKKKRDREMKNRTMEEMS